ncbi:MAG: hypothetical protein IIZ92_06315, partial [Aquincola sp.]|nr:hypothetical protein [Aquincola sp.]
DLARLVGQGSITRDEALANADSPTNLLWRLQNAAAQAARPVARAEESDVAVYTEVTIDVPAPGSATLLAPAPAAPFGGTAPPPSTFPTLPRS